MAKKSAKNIVEEWAYGIRRLAVDGYNSNRTNKRCEALQRIIGNCDAILTTLKCCEDDKE